MENISLRQEGRLSLAFSQLYDEVIWHSSGICILLTVIEIFSESGMPLSLGFFSLLGLLEKSSYCLELSLPLIYVPLSCYKISISLACNLVSYISLSFLFTVEFVFFILNK